MVTLIRERHGQSEDNVAGIASGHIDSPLTKNGKQQARELGERMVGKHFDYIVCSDLQRSYDMAKLAFDDRYPIIKDERLRECDYGNFAGQDKDYVITHKHEYVNKPFPKGESYRQVAGRVQEFLDEFKKMQPSAKVLLITHGGVIAVLEHLLNGVALEEIFNPDKKFKLSWEFKY